jgi:hypothetical protein
MVSGYVGLPRPRRAAAAAGARAAAAAAARVLKTRVMGIQPESGSSSAFFFFDLCLGWISTRVHVNPS